MNIKKTLLILAIGSLLFPGLVATQAATDQELGSIDWSSVGTNTNFWYVGSDNKPAKFNVKVVDADSSLIHEHVSSDADTRVDHYHVQYDYGEDSSQSDANVANANKFWDARIGKERSDVSRISSATTKYNCHIYGFQQSADGGHYEYWINDPSQIYTDDFVLRADNNDVSAYDLLRYGSSTHTSVVRSAPSTRPTEIRWKMGESGVYSYDSPADQEQAFNTPECTGSISQTKTLDNQDWTWDQDNNSGPNVYRDD